MAVCLRDGCSKPTWNGNPGYCSKTHRDGGFVTRPELLPPPAQLQYEWVVDTRDLEKNPCGEPEWTRFHVAANFEIEKAYEDPLRDGWRGKIWVFDKDFNAPRLFDQRVDFRNMVQVNTRRNTKRDIQRLERGGQWECKVPVKTCERLPDGQLAYDWKVYSPENNAIIEAAYQSGLTRCDIYLPQISERTGKREWWLYECTLSGARGTQMNPKTCQANRMRRRPGIGQGIGHAPGQAKSTIAFPTLLGLSSDEIPEPGTPGWESIPDLRKAWLHNLQEGTALYQQLKSLFEKTSHGPFFPAGNVTRIQLIHAESMEQAWIGASEGSLNYPSPLSSTVTTKMNTPAAKDGMNNLKHICLQIGEIGGRFKELLSDPNILFVWHGGPSGYLHKIAAAGPRKLRRTDGGFFGAGIYTTPEAWYACLYALMAMNAYPVPDTFQEYGVILFAATLGTPYVVTRENDYPLKVDGTRVILEGDEVSHFYSENPCQGIALMPGVDTHYVACKAPPGSVNFQACREADAQCHEVVLDSVQQLCPIAIFYFTQPA